MFLIYLYHVFQKRFNQVIQSLSLATYSVRKNALIDAADSSIGEESNKELNFERVKVVFNGKHRE